MTRPRIPAAGEKIANYRMSEFFVRNQHRRAGIGRDAATLIFDRFAGEWEIVEYHAPSRFSGVLAPCGRPLLRAATIPNDRRTAKSSSASPDPAAPASTKLLTLKNRRGPVDLQVLCKPHRKPHLISSVPWPRICRAATSICRHFPKLPSKSGAFWRTPNPPPIRWCGWWARSRRWPARLLRIANSASLNRSGRAGHRSAHRDQSHRLQHGAQRGNVLLDESDPQRQQAGGPGAASERSVGAQHLCGRVSPSFWRGPAPGQSRRGDAHRE